MGNFEIKNITEDHAVYFSTGKITVGTGINLTNVIIVAQTGVEFKGGGGPTAVVSAPLPYPAVISGGNVTKSSGSFRIIGTVYAQGTVDINPVDVTGVLIGQHVVIQGSSNFTDNHNTDPNYLKYYMFMPGFTYPPQLKIAAVVQGSWKEIQ